MLAELRAILAGLILLVVFLIAGLIYWRGSSNATTKADMRVARETIKVEREALKITHTINMRVNAEGIQTANTAQGAASEIEAIRRLPDRTHGGLSGGPTELVESPPTDRPSVCDDRCARVLQLAREARAAAVASGARLQSAGASTR